VGLLDDESEGSGEPELEVYDEMDEGQVRIPAESIDDSY
jgi:hypothetical protein